MTDISELAQKAKFDSWFDREYNHLESSKFTDIVPHIRYGFWMAYKAACVEQTEALEKAKAQIAELEAGKESEHREWMARGVASAGVYLRDNFCVEVDSLLEDYANFIRAEGVDL